MISYSAAYTDQYQLTMAQAYFLNGKKDDRAVFDYFFRKLPFKGGYAIFAGLETLIKVLEDIHFTENDIFFLEKQGFKPEFIEYLKTFRFNGNIYSSAEGDIVFPSRPVLQVEANLIEAQIIESLLLNILNFQTLIATKASRMRRVAGERKLIDFGLRRAQGPGSYYASRAAIIGGFDATSHVAVGRDFNIPVSGTMAHSFIQSYEDELSAFRAFADSRPDDCVLLTDTYDTLRSGLPNAIKVGKEMERKGKKLKGIRLDSGDLAYLARESRKLLDEAGMEYVRIAASNQLDEYIIRSLLEQDAPIDLFGVGTSLVTGSPDAALDGVYKLTSLNGRPRLKISENTEKTTIPYLKQVFRLRDKNGNLNGLDLIVIKDETRAERVHHIFEERKSLPLKNTELEPLLNDVMMMGERVSTAKGLDEISHFSRQRLKELPEEFKRFEYPHIYKVGISSMLKKQRDDLIRNNSK